MNRVVLVDSLNTIFICWHIARKQVYDLKREKGEEPIFTENDVPFLLHIIMKKINNYFSTYGKAIFCFEGYKSLEWRRSIFPDYKRNRDKTKGEDEYKIIKGVFPVIEEILKFYPCKILRSEMAEADDIIYTLSEKYHNDNEVIIISTDNDLSQILNSFDNVSLYNPVKMKYVERQPNILLEKAIVGDASDNIPGLSRIGEKTFAKMMEDRTFFNEKMANGNKEIVNKFLQIIDLSKFPQNYREDILDKDLKTDYNNFDVGSIEEFFFRYKLREQLERWPSVAGDIQIALKRKRQ